MDKSFAILPVILLLSLTVLGTGTVLSVKAESQADSVTNEASSFMENVFGYNMSMYNLTLTDNYQTGVGGYTHQHVSFNLTSSDGNTIQVMSEFVNGTPNNIGIKILNKTSSPYYVEPLPKPVSVKASAILNRYQNYQNFTVSSYIQPILDMLNAPSIYQSLNSFSRVGPNSGLSFTHNNIKIQFTLYNDGRSEISWKQSYDGIDFASKSVTLNFDKYGNVHSLVDNWNIYSIGSTDVNISLEQAANLAWRMASNISSVYIFGIGTLPLYWNNSALVFLDVGVRDNLTGYKYYDVFLVTNLTYNSGYGGFQAEVIVWADTGQAKIVNQGNVWMFRDPSSGTKIQPDPVSSFSGNITSSQMSLVAVSDNQASQVTELSFNVTGQAGIIGFSNLTITKNALSYGEIPFVFIDNNEAQNQGYTQDSNNYYVWYTTEFSTHQISIIFSSSIHPSPAASGNSGSNLSKPFPTMTIAAVSGAIIIIATAGLLVYFKKHKSLKTVGFGIRKS